MLTTVRGREQLIGRRLVRGTLTMNSPLSTGQDGAWERDDARAQPRCLGNDVGKLSDRTAQLLSCIRDLLTAVFKVVL